MTATFTPARHTDGTFAPHASPPTNVLDLDPVAVTVTRLADGGITDRRAALQLTEQERAAVLNVRTWSPMLDQVWADALSQLPETVDPTRDYPPADVATLAHIGMTPAEFESDLGGDPEVYERAVRCVRQRSATFSGTSPQVAAVQRAVLYAKVADIDPAALASITARFAGCSPSEPLRYLESCVRARLILPFPSAEKDPFDGF